MLFNSFEYLVFLPIVFLLYWNACKSGRSKNILLIGASYIFYGWWSFRLLWLIIMVSAVAYVGGIVVASRKSTLAVRRAMLTAVVVLNIGILVAFKYYGFFASSFVRVLNAIGFTPDIPTLNLILPVGISFYSFQAISYVIDVYRRKIPATTDITAFFAYICFFPQLVAGPIERASNILPQFLRDKRRFSYKRGKSGMQLILWGLFKKMVIADNAANAVNTIFSQWETIGTINLWIGAVLFSFQIYGDFSGYSDIATGSSRLFGIDLMKNFNLPYFSHDIVEFWKKWHISLTSWFRDYLYIPLGGNRKGRKKEIRNTIIVFIVSGLWHGANFTYILWGAYHALLYVPAKFLRKANTGNDNYTPRKPTFFKEAFWMGITFLLVMVGWVIFRAETSSDAVRYIISMFSNYIPADGIIGKTPLLWCAVLMLIEWRTRSNDNPLAFSDSGIMRNTYARWVSYIALFLICLFFAGSPQEFIYFRF
ncbi:MAG: MBOAT family protein [Muribaculaceae bacterium]|nr:MBOAT family protein [Muribaculaceae bacterium]